MYVITGATGNIGSKITNNLLDKKMKVRVIGRDAKRLKTFVDRGAEPWIGNLEDTEFLTKAFTGATTVFTMVPPDLKTTNMREYQNKIGESITTAIKKSGVTHVVNLSSIGANLPSKTGPIQGLHDQELRLNKLTNINIVHLRPAYFMENIMSTMDMIKTQNMVGTPLNGALRFPMIATKDVADVATELITKTNFTGHTVRELLGPKDVTYNEIVRVIGDTIGKKDLKYIQFPYEDARGAMVKSGISDNVASAFTEMARTMNEGHLTPETRRTPQTTTPTSVEEFAKTFARHYKQR